MATSNDYSRNPGTRRCRRISEASRPYLDSMRGGDELASDLHVLLQDTAVAVNEMAAGQVVEGLSAAVGIPAFSIFGRARELVVSSAVLVDAERTSTALILQRPLFEDAVLLSSVAAADESTRISLMARWLRESFNNLDGLARDSRRLDPTSMWFPDMIEEYVKQRREQLDRLLSRKGIKAAPRFNWEALANRQDRSDALLDYAVSHQAVHGNEFVHLMSRETRPDGSILSGKASSYFIALTCTLAVGSALQVADAAVALFGIAAPPQSALLRARLHALMDEHEEPSVSGT